MAAMKCKENVLTIFWGFDKKIRPPTLIEGVSSESSVSRQAEAALKPRRLRRRRRLMKNKTFIKCMITTHVQTRETPQTIIRNWIESEKDAEKFEIRFVDLSNVEGVKLFATVSRRGSSPLAFPFSLFYCLTHSN